jgi:hypothetical protein
MVDLARTQRCWLGRYAPRSSDFLAVTVENKGGVITTMIWLAQLHLIPINAFDNE